MKKIAHQFLIGDTIGGMDHDEITQRPEITEAEAAWLDHFVAAMSRPGPEEEAFFAGRRELGLGVGLDEDGRLVRQE